MPIYYVKRNGTEIFNGKSLVSPKLHLELNAAGYLEFDTTDGQAANLKDVVNDTYTVYEGTSLIFAGRPTEITTKYNNKKHYYIEGAYGYLNDTLVAPFVYQSKITFDDAGGATMDAQDMLSYIVEQHNTQVPDNRKIKVIQNNKSVHGNVYRKFDFDKSIEALSSLREELGGVMYITYSSANGTTPCLVWVSELPSNGKQTVELGKNILDLSRKIAGTDIPSAIVPIGPTISSTDSVDEVDDLHILTANQPDQYLVGQNLTLTNRTNVNNGKIYITNSLADSVGLQFEKVEFSSVKSASELLQAAREYMTRKILQTMFVDVDIADLHYAKGYEDNERIDFATNLNVIATKYNPPIKTSLPISSMDIQLDNAVKKISLGTLRKSDLSEKLKKDNAITKSNESDLQSQIDDIKGNESSNGNSGISFAHAPCGVAHIGRQRWNPQDVPLNGLKLQASKNVITSFVVESMTLYAKSIPCPLQEYFDFGSDTSDVSIENTLWEGELTFINSTSTVTVRGYFLCSVKFVSESNCKIYVQDFHGASPSDRLIVCAATHDENRGSWYCTNDSLTINTSYSMSFSAK